MPLKDVGPYRIDFLSFLFSGISSGVTSQRGGALNVKSTCEMQLSGVPRVIIFVDQHSYFYDYILECRDSLHAK